MMIGKLIALAVIGVSLTVPGRAPTPKGPTVEEIIQAGKCMNWDSQVVDMLPSTMAMHPALSPEPMIVDHATVVRPSAQSCDVLEKDKTIGFEGLNTKWMSAVNLRNEDNTIQTFHFLVDLGSDETGAHRYLGWKHIVLPSPADKLEPL